jgi:beta-lactam-binding protein with PASTA domain
VPFVVDTAAGSLMARVGRRLPAHDALGPLADVLLEAAAPDPADRLDAEAFGRRLASLAEVLGEPAPLPMPTRLAARLRERGAADEVLWASRGTGEPTLVPPPNALPSRGLDAPPQRAGDAAPLSGQAQLSAEERGGLGSARGGPGPAPLLGTDPGPRGRARAAMRGDQVGPAGRRRLGRVLVVAAVLLALVAGGGSIAAWRVGWFLPVRRVPQVIGSSVRIAEARLARAGFRPVVSARTHDVSVPQGAVVSERPAAGRRLRVRSRVELVVSLGPPPVAVPSLARAHGCKDVAQLLEAAHLRAACSQAPSTSVPAGEVVSWSPHRSAPWGSTVQVVVSSGPPMVQVPDVTGDTVPVAIEAIQRAGLVAGNVYGPASGTVFHTNPSAGSSAPEGSSVDLYTQ